MFHFKPLDHYDGQLVFKISRDSDFSSHFFRFTIISRYVYRETGYTADPYILQGWGIPEKKSSDLTKFCLRYLFLYRLSHQNIPTDEFAMRTITKVDNYTELVRESLAPYQEFSAYCRSCQKDSWFFEGSFAFKHNTPMWNELSWGSIESMASLIALLLTEDDNDQNKIDAQKQVIEAINHPKRAWRNKTRRLFKQFYDDELLPYSTYQDIKNVEEDTK
ncbi:MAG: hypothetical protein R3A11_08305 [Bdellovibrionota bacterium]